MNKMTNPASLSRRSLLKGAGAGALVVSIGAPIGLNAVLGITKAHAEGTRPPLVPNELSSYLAVNADGTVSVYFGKMDLGHGMHTAIGQIVAEELDVPFKSVTVYMGDTDTSVNQGGASGSTGLMDGGKQMRMAAAEGRRVLVEMAAKKLSVTPDKISVVDGRCIVGNASDDAVKNVSYAELLSGQYFNTQLDWNHKEGNALYAPGKALPKDPKDYKIVGKDFPRGDVAWRVYATGDFVTDIKVPGMIHGRVIRPPVAGAVPVSVDESSIAHIPTAKVLREKDFIGVVADKEWNAIRAMRDLKIKWSEVTPPFVNTDEIYDHIRKTPIRKSAEDKKTKTGDIDAAFAGAAKTIEAEYEWPYQSHASMGGACSLVQIKDGEVHCWSGTQKSHYLREGIAKLLQTPIEKVHVKWVTGPGSYGRNDADDCGHDAALMAKLAGKPVRVQYMRDQGTGWDPKGPASIHKVRAAIDAQGKVIAYDYLSKGFSRVDVNTKGSSPSDTLAGQLTGAKLKSEDGFGYPSESYAFDNKRYTWQTIAPQLDRASPLRTSHLRDPVGPQITFASESFIDEMAHAVDADPIEFRLRHVKNPRDVAVIKKAAELYKWDTRPSPRKDQKGNKVSGRGIAYSVRNGTRVAVIAEVSVDRSSGKIHATRFAVAHDCGQIVNPRSLKTTIEGNIVQGTSRTLFEEVKFDPKNVTSVDWLTYPILDMSEKPGKVDIALIDRPEVAMSGAGEPSTRPVAAAIANAIFDATGVRIRRVPLTPERVKAALS